ncbi:MAG: RES family NAD+ phosphorylase [Sphingobacteriales bacterium]
MLVYRIAHKMHTDYLYAPGFAGRWNKTGKKVLYCAESVSLAFLESMIRRQGVGFNHDYNIIIIEAPDDLAVSTIPADSLADGWRDFRDYSVCQKIGNEWFDNFETPILKVPSAVVVECYNYVINTLHNDFDRIKVIGVTELAPDARIDELLKRYKAEPKKT